MEHSGTLTVRNVAQQALFELELSGQISDGHWENAGPRDHWIVWCRAKVVVGEKLGRDFWARRDDYALSSPRLLEVVEKRMLAYARLAIAFGFDVAKLADDSGVMDLDGEVRTDPPTGEGQYWDKVRAAIATLPVAEWNRVAKDESSYTGKDLRRDLRDLRQIMKVQVTG